MVIGAGVYEDTRGTRIVAGAEVPDRVEHGGRAWTLTSLRVGPGLEDIRILTDRKGAQEEVLVGIALSGLDTLSAWDISLDGGVVESGSRGAAWTGRRGCRGGPSSGARSTTCGSRSPTG